MFFDDMYEGFTFETPGHVFTEEEIIDYARVYDPQPFHLDREAAAASIYGGLIASGLQTCAISFALTLRANIINESSMGSPGMDRIRWLKPVRPGDEIRVTGTVRSATPSASRPDRGRVETDYVVRNQRDEPVLTYSITHLQRRRAASI
ncbi:MaoC-like dehydratase [Pseudooceanicola batsensis HTCC2597]|uniref:MaoC-like dehydratase n=1 Tax=Pseudooceanicola batsensis (strain ATCC BAA-863 / DSM 15984 / KCTC 12145 / HTCC2597) TaxID=252305 RepID=A3U2A3_PSEBH|nr:MaoC family dehydratase [Pseudooceanicola batsensis]EAQ01703.1 MaoC-like dehydratase [Pseudooceanicola batsensis HTCC2597]